VTLRVATVLSIREWEPALVNRARDSAALRIIVRAFQPHDIDRYIDDLDVIVVGGDTAWLTPAHVRNWRNSGVSVLGVSPAGDGPASSLLLAGGVDDVVPDSMATEALIQAIRFIAPEASVVQSPQAGTRVGVLGARGAPGCTEVAVAYALSVADHGSCILLDLDTDAPSVAIRLGLEPRPDLADAIDAVRQDGTLDPSVAHHVGSLAVISGLHRRDREEVRDSHVEAVVRAAANRFSTVVMDLGTSESAHRALDHVDDAILVVDGSALGIVRAAHLVQEWMGPAPALVLNRVDPSGRDRAVEAARRWTGLDPSVVIRDRRAVRRAACAARAPERRFARSVARLGHPS
jgi:Flp pilus assembly CpaE family ATPase